ncbi:MAG: mechanosensitive ion channel family protein [Desulfobacteraceae bacterium]|nr:mechanosensitive ion channel family protein [Desulfobacteraceae bacterium]
MHLLKINVLGNTIQAYLISMAILIAAVLFSVVANRFLKKHIHNWTKKTKTDLDDLIVERVFSPLVYFILIFGLAMAKSHLKLAESISSWLDKILFVLGLVLFFVILSRFIQGLIELVASGYIKRIRQKSPVNLEDYIRNADRVKKQVREISKMVLGLLAILTVLSNLGVDLKAIWASLGIGGIALVVAVQEPLRNLVGRIYIFSTGIFDEGHFIVFNNWAGTVKRIATFRTYLELFSDMTTVSIPNSDFVKGVVKTYYGRTKFMYKWDLDVPYDITPQRIQELVVRLRELITNKSEVNQDMCWIYLERLDRYSKVVRVWFQVNLPGWAESLFYGNKVLHDIQLVFESMHIPFAFPTQTLLLNRDNPLEGAENQDPVPAVLPESDEDSADPTSPCRPRHLEGD